MYMYNCTLGWRDFKEKNVTLAMLCQIVLGSKIQNFTLYCFFFILISRPQKSVTVITKSVLKNIVMRFLSLQQGGRFL